LTVLLSIVIGLVGYVLLEYWPGFSVA